MLKNVQEPQHFLPYGNQNVEETSIFTVPTKNAKVFADDWH